MQRTSNTAKRLTLEDRTTHPLCLLQTEEVSARVSFLLLTCSKISCLAVTSFSNQSIFSINFLPGR